MAAKKCARLDCGGAKAHPVHSRWHPQYHAFEDARPVGIKPISDDRDAYLRSQQHKEAYAGLGDVCLPHAAGAPGRCSGEITPGHVFSRGQAGGLETAEEGWPVIAECTYFNTDVDAKPATRKWAEGHTFVWHKDGNEYPFRINAAMARRIKEERENRTEIRL